MRYVTLLAAAATVVGMSSGAMALNCPSAPPNPQHSWNPVPQDPLITGGEQHVDVQVSTRYVGRGPNNGFETTTTTTTTEPTYSQERLLCQAINDNNQTINTGLSQTIVGMPEVLDPGGELIAVSEVKICGPEPHLPNCS